MPSLSLHGVTITVSSKHIELALTCTECQRQKLYNHPDYPARCHSWDIKDHFSNVTFGEWTVVTRPNNITTKKPVPNLYRQKGIYTCTRCYTQAKA